MEQALGFRQRLLDAQQCSFSAIVTADYGDKLYTFTLDCQGDKQGNLTFEVVQPQSISGITGTITEESGQLTFDDKALAFATLADGQIVPVCAPWILLRSLRSGYLSACGKYGDGIEIIVDDSYQEDALQLNIQMNGALEPVSADILWQGRRMLSLIVSNFSIM